MLYIFQPTKISSDTKDKRVKASIKNQPGPTTRFKMNDKSITKSNGSAVLSKKAKRRLRQKIRKNNQGEKITAEWSDLRKEVDILKSMKRLKSTGTENGTKLKNEFNGIVENGEQDFFPNPPVPPLCVASTDLPMFHIVLCTF